MFSCLRELILAAVVPTAPRERILPFSTATSGTKSGISVVNYLPIPNGAICDAAKLTIDEGTAATLARTA